MKRNVLVVDPSIMIHKIVQLAFPEEQYEVIISNNYPLENEPEGPVHLALISADLPGHEDVLETALSIKKSYDCPILLMIPKFHDHDAQHTSEAGIDGTIEKPFTSDALKERVAGLTEVPDGLDDMESLSQEELESITDDEFMLSEEDLMDIGEEDLADVEIPEDLPSGVEPDTEEMAEVGPETLETPPTPEPAREEEPETPETEEEPVLLDAEEEQEFGDFEDEEDHVLDEPEEDTPSGDMPFDDMGIEDDLDSIDFGDLGEDDQLIAEDALKDLPQAQTESDGETEEPGPAFDIPEEEATQPTVSEPETEVEDAASEPEPEMEPIASEEPTPEPEDLADAFQLEAEPESAEETEQEAEPVAETEAAAQEPDVEEEEVEVDFAIQDEPTTVQLNEYEVETPVEEPEETREEEEAEPEPIPEPLDLSYAEEDHEVIHPPSSLSDAAAVKSLLSDEDIERIAKRVIEVLGRDALKEVAWEVIPVVAEEVVRSRIRELEQEQD